MNDYPIVAGSALFTLVDLSKGHEVATTAGTSATTSTPDA